MSLDIKDANDSTVTLKTNGSGTHIQNVQVDSIAAGDNNIGNVDVVTLPTFPAGDNNIGNVDVVTLPSIPAGTNNIGDVDVVSLPGTVAADITSTKTAVEIIDNAISGNEMQVDIVSIAQPSSMGNGKKTVAVAGTAEVLTGSNTVNNSVFVKALHANTNMVYVGVSGVSSSDGYVLDAGESVELHVNNTNMIYIDVDTNGEGVTFIYS